MVEWLVLLLVIPAVVVPVVLLFGFAGCELLFPLNAGPPLPPVILSADAAGAASIRIEWDDPNTGGTTFVLNRTKEGDGGSTPFETAATTFLDEGLEPGTTYLYNVIAIRTEDGEESPASETAQATTLSLEPAFAATLTNNQNREGRCIVQRIEPSRLFRGGTLIALTVQAATNAGLVIDRIFISQVAGSGNPYDSAGDLTAVASTLFVAQNTSVTLPPVAYTLDRTQPLLVAFDIGSPGGVLFAPAVPSSEAEAFVGPAPAADVAARPPGFIPIDRIYLVARIDAG